jgi:acetyl esterase/lipase
MKRSTVFFLLICILCSQIRAQEIFNLYPGTIPNSKQTNIIDSGLNLTQGLIRRSLNPTLQVFLPEKDMATGTAVVIIPGGSYTVIVYQGEGINTAKELAKNGITAFVLKYRLPNDSFVIDRKIGTLQDAQQAIKMVRENASKWRIDPKHIGIMGFSAGGHIASTEATHYKNALIENKNNTSLRPDFQILVYPVISMQDSLTHQDSRNHLLGKNLSKELKDEYSNEMKVEEDSPPAYITHAGDDKTVDVDNSIAYYESLRHHKVPVEMHLYPKGGHGFVFRMKDWMDPLIKWIKSL